MVNADDFGFTPDVNSGIVEAHRRGILTATTLMATGDAFDDAVRLARDGRLLYSVIDDIELVSVARDCGAAARRYWLAEWSAANHGRVWAAGDVLRAGDLVAVPDAWVDRADGLAVPAALGAP